MRYRLPSVWFSTLVLLACTDSQTIRTRDPACDSPCYQGEARHAGVGICAFGRWRCDDVGDLVSCDGAGVPLPRECNGLDNDCNGAVDSILQTCSTLCGTGTRLCHFGVWEACTAPVPVSESCNGKDDDCDGFVDEDVPVEACFDAPSDRLRSGECRYGVSRCRDGHIECFGQILPTPEVCDGKDNDCNGQVDDGLGGKAYDFVFAIDESGSMGTAIWGVKRSTQTWGTKYAGRSDLRFAIVLAPGPRTDDNEIVRLYSDLEEASIFAQKIDAQSDGFTASEPTLDALYDVASSSNPLKISWRASSHRAVILFTDEEAQSYRAPKITPEEIVKAAQATGTKIVVFTDPTYYTSFQDTGAILRDLNGDIGRELDRLFRDMTCR